MLAQQVAENQENERYAITLTLTKLAG